MTNKALCLLSLLVVGYFILLFIHGYLIKIELPLLGAIQELVTLPALVLQVALMVVAARRLSQTGLLRDAYLLTSFTSLSVSASVVSCACVVLGKQSTPWATQTLLWACKPDFLSESAKDKAKWGLNRCIGLSPGRTDRLPHLG